MFFIILLCGCETVELPDLPNIPDLTISNPDSDPDPEPDTEPTIVEPEPEPELPLSSLPTFPAKLYPNEFKIEGKSITLFGTAKNNVTHCCIQNANGNTNWEGTDGSYYKVINGDGWTYTFDQIIKNGDLIVMERGANEGETRNTILWCLYIN